MRVIGVVLGLSALLIGGGAVQAGEDHAGDRVRLWVSTLSTHASPEAERVAAREGIAATEPASRAQAVVRLLLSSASDFGRMEGAQITKLMGSDAIPLLPDLIENLLDRSSFVREAAAAAIGVVAACREGQNCAAWPAAVDGLVRLLDDHGHGVAVAALASLARLDRLDDGAVLAQLLDRGSGTRLLDAALRHEDAASSLLRELLSSSSWHLRRAVLLQLSMDLRRRPADSVIAIPVGEMMAQVSHLATEDTSTAVRVWAVRVLGTLGGEALGEALAGVLSDEDDNVRAAVFYSIAHAGLANHPSIKRGLITRLASRIVAERAAAAWLLRGAAAADEEVTSALRQALSDAAPSVIEASAAALLSRGASESGLLANLLTRVRTTGVAWPYPRPRHSEHAPYFSSPGAGRRMFDSVRFFPPRLDAAWCTKTIARLGAAVVPALVKRLAASAPAQRRLWIHALGHAGSAGREALASQEVTLSASEAFERDLIRIHAGASDMKLVTLMLAVVQRAPVAEASEADADRATLQAALALDALVMLAPLSVEPLVSAFAGATDTEEGFLPRWLSELEAALRAIGQPALASVERAAKDKDTGCRFTQLLATLRR